MQILLNEKAEADGLIRYQFLTWTRSVLRIVDALSEPIPRHPGDLAYDYQIGAPCSIVRASREWIYCRTSSAGVVAVRGFVLESEGIGLHHKLRGKGWSVTSLRYGAVIRSAPTLIAAVQKYISVRDQIDAAIAADLRIVPITEDERLAAQPWSRPKKPCFEKHNARVADALAAKHKLSNEERDAVVRALSRSTGRLKERAPSEPLAKAAWYGLQSRDFGGSYAPLLGLGSKAKALFIKISGG